MSRWVRFVKPTLVVAGVWSVAWSVIGAALGLFLTLAGGISAIPALPFLVLGTTIGFGIFGFSAGALFAIALTLLEWGAPAEHLQTSRVALSGAVGGGLLPIISGVSASTSGAPWMVSLIPIVFFALLGMASSLLTLRLVRGPARREAESPTRAAASLEP